LRYKNTAKEPMGGEYFRAQYAELLQQWHESKGHPRLRVMDRVPIPKQLRR
jgi:hypothetical protein